MPDVSVIVPVYRAEPYLRCCVDSILAQTFTDFELILVDDGSPDNCPAICDEYAETDERVRVIHQQNRGQSAARNRAVTQARGEWLCFVDSDDAIHPQLVEVLFRAVKEYHVQMSMCGTMEAQEIPDSFWKEAEANYSSIRVSEEWLFDLHQRGDYRFWIVCGKLIHKDIYLNAPLAEGRVYEDGPAVCKWFLSQKNVVNINCDLYFYRVNSNGTTKSAFSPKRLDHLWAHKEIITSYRQAGYFSLMKAVFFSYVYHANIFYHKCLEIPEYRKMTKSIQRQLRTVYRFVRQAVPFPYHERVNVWYILYPRTMKILRYGRRSLRKLRKLGGRQDAAN